MTGRDLYEAAKNNDVQKVREYIARGDEVNYVEPGTGDTPLHVTTHPEIIEELVTVGGLSVNTTNDFGATPLLLACARGDSSGVQHLLKMPKINLEIPNGAGATPLISAAAQGKSDIVKDLIAHGAVVETKGSRTTLHFAKTREVVEILLAHSASLDNCDNPEKMTPLEDKVYYFSHHASRYLSNNEIERTMEIMKLFVERGAKDNNTSCLNPEWLQENGVPVLVQRIWAIPVEVAKFLRDPDVEKIIAASQDPETGELFTKNLSSRVMKLAFSPQQAAPLIVAIPSLGSVIPEGYQQDVAKLVVENLQKNGVPAESVPEYLNIMSEHCPFIKTVIDQVLKSDEVVKDGASILQHLTSLLTELEREQIPEMAKVEEIFFGIYDQIYPDRKKQGIFTDEQKNELKSYQDDPSLFLSPILKSLDIIVGALKEDVEIGNIVNEAIRMEIKGLKGILHPDGKPFKYLGTVSQVKKLQERLKDIDTLANRVAKYEKYYPIVTSEPIPKEIEALKKSLKRHINSEDLVIKTPSSVKTTRDRSNSR